MYIVIVGFFEVGEILEQCVVCEVFEEIGIKVKNICYFGSQFWVFFFSMMMGFVVEYQFGIIKLDYIELSDVCWFGVDKMLQVVLVGMIVRVLIEYIVVEIKEWYFIEK